MGKGKGSPAQRVGQTVTVTMRMGRQGGEDVRERKRGGCERGRECVGQGDEGEGECMWTGEGGHGWVGWG